MTTQKTIIQAFCTVPGCQTCMYIRGISYTNPKGRILKANLT